MIREIECKNCFSKNIVIENQDSTLVNENGDIILNITVCRQCQGN